MVAAAEGNLTLLKLSMDVLHAKDEMIGPNWQLALGLAVEGGHKEAIDFLPTRRGGGCRRWKMQHAIALGRVKCAMVGITLQIFRVECP